MTSQEELREIYATIPRLACKMLCQQCCGPIGCSEFEARHIFYKTQTKVGRVNPKDFCTLLTDSGTCSIYEHRPLICRLWGTVKAMQCPHGCEPERWLSDSEARELIQRAEKLT